MKILVKADFVLNIPRGEFYKLQLYLSNIFINLGPLEVSNHVYQIKLSTNRRKSPDVRSGLYRIVPTTVTCLP